VLWWVCVGMLVLVALWGLGFGFTAWVPCFPVNVFWDFNGPERNCYGFGAPVDRVAYVAHTSSNMVLDIIIFFLPVPASFNWTTTWRSRFAMAGLIFIGCL